MLDDKGFDLWADHYDQTVDVYEQNNEFPFAGYKRVMNTVYTIAKQNAGSKVLDIGIGTGFLTSKLYEEGYNISGMDFSHEMIQIAQKKMPQAKLYHLSFHDELPIELTSSRFDIMISTYALHHLMDEAKWAFIRKMMHYLEEDGVMIIGDVSFKTNKDYEMSREANSETWDYDEYYFINDYVQKNLADYEVKYEQISHCAGVYMIMKRGS